MQFNSLNDGLNTSYCYVSIVSPYNKKQRLSFSLSIYFFFANALMSPFKQLLTQTHTRNTHTYHTLKLHGKLNIIQQQQWPAEAPCGTEQPLCEIEQIHYANRLPNRFPCHSNKTCYTFTLPPPAVFED